MREAYHWTGSGWKCSARYMTRADLDGLGMSAQSVRTAADALAARGWIDKQTRGNAHAYRWRLSAPRSRFTYLPLGLFYDHARLSHSGLTLLLALYRATWGWTRYEDGTTEHKAHATLSASKLSAMTGLCPSTLRTAAEKVIHNAAERWKTAPGGAYSWRPDPSFFRYTRTKSAGGTSRERKSFQQTRTGAEKAQGGSCGRFVAGKGEDEGRKAEGLSLSETEQRWTDWLMSDPFGMPYHTAARLVASRSLEVLQETRGMFERQQDGITNPGGWMNAALSEVWASKTDNKTPEIRQSGGSGAFSGALDNLRTKSTEGGHTKSTGGATSTASGQRLGLSHSQMSSAVFEIRGLTADHFDQIDHGGGKPTWIPTKETGNWLWRRGKAGQLDEEAERHARRCIQSRKAYEQATST
jgi:hypothetical protein